MFSKWTLCFYNPWDFIYWKRNKISHLKKNTHEIPEISDIRNLGPVYISCHMLLQLFSDIFFSWVIRKNERYGRLSLVQEWFQK